MSLMAKEQHVEMLKQGSEIWNRWRESNHLIKPDLSDLDLTNLSLNDMVLSGTTLNGTNLSGATLIGAILSGAVLSGADLHHANLKDSYLRSADLRDANLSDAYLMNADLSDADCRCARFNSARLTNSILRGAKLCGADLSQTFLINADMAGATIKDANLRQAYLNNTDLSRVDLSNADLNLADLSGSNLTDANLNNTNLSDANLSGANLESTKLDSAKLVGANLNRAYFSSANLHDADFHKAEMGWTKLADLDLSVAIRLDSVRHFGPSTVGIDTIYKSRGNISEGFLRSAGVPDTLLTYMTSLTGEAIQYYSCFLSHAEPDGEFADRLRSDLLSNNVSCWHYRYDMRGGQFWRVQINEAIKVHEKLVLVCSERSVLRRNVVDEIITAMERERETRSQKLFPIRLDDFILSNDTLEIADSKMKAGEWREDWVRYIRAYHIPDFRNWKDHDSYQIEFSKLLHALKNPAKR